MGISRRNRLLIDDKGLEEAGVPKAGFVSSEFLELLCSLNLQSRQVRIVRKIIMAGSIYWKLVKCFAYFQVLYIHCHYTS